MIRRLCATCVLALIPISFASLGPGDVPAAGAATTIDLGGLVTSALSGMATSANDQSFCGQGVVDFGGTYPGGEGLGTVSLSIPGCLQQESDGSLDFDGTFTLTTADGTLAGTADGPTGFEDAPGADLLLFLTLGITSGSGSLAGVTGALQANLSSPVGPSFPAGLTGSVTDFFTQVLVPTRDTVLTGETVLDSAAYSAPGDPVTRVVFELNDNVIATATLTMDGWLAQWDSASAPDGSGSLVSVATDANGDTTTSQPVSVTTDNPAPPVVTSPGTEHGYWLVGSDGGIFSFGSAAFHGSTGSLVLQRPAVGIVPTGDDGGYWVDASDGGVFSFGDTRFYGAIPGLGLHPAGSGLPNSLAAPIVGMVPSNDDGGYFMVGSDGGVFAFGDAHFAGSCPGIGGCSGAAVAVMPDASGNGYWLVTQTGHVYAFGDAHYDGAPDDAGSPVTSAVRTPSGDGYWILTADGSVFSYGDAESYGSAAGLFGGLNPASSIFATSDGGGYWVASANGTVVPFGDAPDDGGMAGARLNGSIVAGTGF